MCGSGSKNMAKKDSETHHRLNQRAPESGSKTAAHALSKTTDYYGNVHYYIKKQEQNWDRDHGSKETCRDKCRDREQEKESKNTGAKRPYISNVHVKSVVNSNSIPYIRNIPMLKQL